MNLPQPVVTGVYFLFKDRALTYTGKSRNVYARIEEHRSNGRQFDYAMVSACPAQDMDWVEAALIRGMAPPENLALKPRRPLAVASLSDYRAVEKRTDELPADPSMVVSKARALEYAAHFRLAGPMRQAVASGALPSRQPGGRGTIMIRVGDLKAWCETTASA